jgi:cell division protein FtsB
MKKRKEKQNKIWLSLNLCLVFIFVLGGFLFLNNMKDLDIKNFELKALEEELDLLEDEKKEMEASKNALESSELISSRLEGMSMVEVSEVDYISAGGDSLAKR